MWRCRTCCGYSFVGTEVAFNGLGAVVRAYGQARRIERIIGKGRPKGMRFKRYDRLLQEHRRYSEKAVSILETYSSALIMRIGAAMEG